MAYRYILFMFCGLALAGGGGVTCGENRMVQTYVFSKFKK